MSDESVASVYVLGDCKECSGRGEIFVDVTQHVRGCMGGCCPCDTYSDQEQCEACEGSGIAYTCIHCGEREENGCECNQKEVAHG